MSYQTFLWVLFVTLLITYSIVKKSGNKKLNATLIVLMLIIFFGQILLPRQLFGRWNSISKLDGKTISKIILRPSSPEWQVNLIGNDFLVLQRQQLDTLINLLRKVEVYSPSHPMRIWETKMTLYSSDKDSLEIEIHQTENNGTVIYTPINEWRKDEIASYLERLTFYKKPVYSDTATQRF